MRWIEKLKNKWGIQSDWDFWMIMLTFSLAGSAIGFVRPIVFHIFGIEQSTPLWIKICAYIPLIPPVYQVGLLFFGFLLGQFPFFWEKEKRLAKFLLGRSKNV
jgi:hypothetical protein